MGLLTGCYGTFRTEQALTVGSPDLITPRLHDVKADGGNGVIDIQRAAGQRILG